MKNLAYLFFILFVLLQSCNTQNKAETEVITVAEGETINEKEVVATPDPVDINENESNETLPTLIEWNPRYTWEEFAFSAGNDLFPYKGLNNYMVWEYEEERFPIIILISNENDFIALTEPEDPLDEGSFQVKTIIFPEDSEISTSPTLSYSYYDWFQQDLDENLNMDFIISMEINGTMGTEDGISPVRYIKSIVLTLDGLDVHYSSPLSHEYNEVAGTTEEFINEPLPELLDKKYRNLASRKSGLEKTALLKELVSDMSIAIKSNEEDGFSKVVKEDGNYVVYASFVGTKYFIVEADNNFGEVKGIDEDFYPLMIDLYQMTDIYSIVSASISNGKIDMTLKPRPESESPRDSYEISFTYNGEYWVMLVDEYEWFPESIRKGLTTLRDD